MQQLFSTQTGEPVPPLAGHATYPGNTEGILAQVCGPTLMREFVVAVEAEHDPVTDKTRVGFAYARQWGQRPPAAPRKVGRIRR